MCVCNYCFAWGVEVDSLLANGLLGMPLASFPPAAAAARLLFFLPVLDVSARAVLLLPWPPPPDLCFFVDRVLVPGTLSEVTEFSES